MPESTVCRHVPCTCRVDPESAVRGSDDGPAFCSAYCLGEAQHLEEDPDAGCDCGHSGCEADS